MIRIGIIDSLISQSAAERPQVDVTCPVCRKHSNLPESAHKEGAITGCPRCGAILTFNPDLTQRVIGLRELQTRIRLSGDKAVRMRRIFAAWRRRMKQYGNPVIVADVRGAVMLTGSVTESPYVQAGQRIAGVRRHKETSCQVQDEPVLGAAGGGVSC